MPSSHELSDANTKVIMWVAICSIGIGAVLFIGFKSAFFTIKSRIKEQTHAVAPLELISKRKGPPSPKLEINPEAKNQRILANQKRLLESYKWIDKEQEAVRIPIEKALEIMSHEP
jgi:hypothetical protein